MSSSDLSAIDVDLAERNATNGAENRKSSQKSHQSAPSKVGVNGTPQDEATVDDVPNEDIGQRDDARQKERKKQPTKQDDGEATAQQSKQQAAAAETQRRRLRLRVFESRARLLEHVGTAALAFVLACIIWFTAISQENPMRTQSYSVPLEIRGVPSGLVLLQNPVEDITLTAKAPQRTLEGLTSDEFRAFVDLTDAEAGVVERQIEVRPPDSRIEIVASQREMLSLQLDPSEEREVRLEARIVDGPAFGYEEQAPILSPISATIRGPQTYVDNVAAAVVEIELNGSNNQVERTELPIQLLDTQGNAVENVRMEPAVASAIVPIEELPGRKEVAVRVNLVGEPARGYRLGATSVEPQTIVLYGDDELLANVPGFVETEELALYDANEDVRQRVRLRLPEGVEAFEGSSVVATVSIIPNIGGLTVSREPIIQNLAEGLVASILLDRVDVILSGPQPLLESLEEDDVRVVINLDGLITGNHIVEPNVFVAEGLQIEDVLPETVQVSISQEISEDESPPPSQ